MSLDMSYEMIGMSMFGGMLLMMLTGQRVFAAIGFVSATAALLLWGTGGVEMPFSAAFKLFNWYPLLTLPLFIYMGYILSESGIADDLYHMFHVWFGGLRGGLAIGTITLMIVISAMNGLSVAGMAIGATIALPEMLRRGYDKIRCCTGWQFLGYFDTAKRGVGIIWNDCTTTGRKIMACWSRSRFYDGSPFHYLYRSSL